MFDFEQLCVYQKALGLNRRVYDFLKNHKGIDLFLQDQLKRASVSIVLNIAEGVGRQTIMDRKKFYVISRGSAFEVATIMQIINKCSFHSAVSAAGATNPVMPDALRSLPQGGVHNQYPINQDEYNSIVFSIKEIIKMLFGLINNAQIKKPREI